MLPRMLTERLLALRKSAGLNTRDVARLADLSDALVSHIECGRIANPRTESIRSIAEVLGCSLDWLVNGEGEPPTAEHVRAAVDAARARLAASAPLPTGTGGR
jgi:transcriptional regulator with XRE-family HTH domain